MNRSSQIVSLIIKFRNRQLTAQELHILQEWAAGDPAYKKLLDDFSPGLGDEELRLLLDDYINQKSNLDFTSVLQRLDNSTKSKISFRTFWFTAACLLLCFSIALLLWSTQYRSTSESIAVVDNAVVAPGIKAALLRQENGKIYELSEQDSLVVSNDGKLIIYAGQKQKILTGGLMTLIVPQGNEFSLRLGDGTQVWLNSKSTLQFPTEFESHHRFVKLEGEAYFDVTSNRDRPFFVENKKQLIKVLGTRFNVSCYPDEDEVITALYEGKVEVEDKIHNKKVDLVPGEVLHLGSSLRATKKERGDISKFNAWTNGLFSFSETPFEEVMKTVSRWYNVEVIYRNSIPKDLFTGEVSRNVSFAVMLDFLKGSGIHIVQKDKQLIVN